MYNSKDYHKDYYEKNKEKINKQNKENYHLHKEQNKEKRKKYSIDNSESNKEKCKKWNADANNKEKVKQWRIENKEKLKNTKKEWRLKNKEKIKEDYNKWRLENKEKINENYKEYIKNRKATDPVFKMQQNIRRLIGNSFKNKGYKKNTRTEKILGCLFKDFKIHIEKQFENWMTFENHGKYNGEYCFGWDIDHIIELKTINSMEDILKLNHYSNLRPLDSKINRVDRNKKES